MIHFVIDSRKWSEKTQIPLYWISNLLSKSIAGLKEQRRILVTFSEYNSKDIIYPFLPELSGGARISGRGLKLSVPARLGQPPAPWHFERAIWGLILRHPSLFSYLLYYPNLLTKSPSVSVAFRRITELQRGLTLYISTITILNIHIRNSSMRNSAFNRHLCNVVQNNTS